MAVSEGVGDERWWALEDEVVDGSVAGAEDVDAEVAPSPTPRRIQTPVLTPIPGMEVRARVSGTVTVCSPRASVRRRRPACCRTVERAV